MARRHSRWPIAAAAILLALVALGAIVLSDQDEPADPPRRAEETATPAATAEPTRTPRPAEREPAPARAIRGFYEAAAEDDWDRAWALAGPGFRSTFGSQDRLQRDLDSLQRIRFRRLRVTERSGDQATVEVSTVATHTDRVDRCTGTLRAVRVERSWRADPLSLSCTSG